MRQYRSLIGKELEGYFGSPMALIFLGIFLVVTLYTFFWVEAFFIGGLAEMRGLFRWMPILMIFLISALTMRQWSEEQRSGTLETLLTLPVGAVNLVLAKFVAVLVMVALAMALTLPLTVTVSTLGNLDWGPVVAGYLATLLLSSSYVALGLFASSRTDNQIVALMLTVIMGGVLYFAGTGVATEFVPATLGSFLRAIGTDSRFASIQRGVIDLRDLVYYLTLTAAFLTLNVLSVQSLRWSRHHNHIRLREILISALIIVNLILANVWLHPLRFLRADMTQQKEFSLSDTTKSLLAGLTEPLIIQGFFSEKTHPLLAPVVPSLSDMLTEYDIAGGPMVELQILDPTTDPDLEVDATQTYGIQPIPFQVAERYETSVRNSYFHVLLRHADQHVVLSVADLVEVNNERDGSTTVTLGTLEYSLTRAIKQVVYGFQSVEAVLETLDEPVRLSFVVTPDLLGESALEDMATVQATGAELADSSEGQFLFELVDPDAADSKFPRETLIGAYGLQPYPASIGAPSEYYFHLILELNDQLHLLFPQGEISRTSIRAVIDETIQRNTPGFLRTVGIWIPPSIPTQNFLGQQMDPLSSWNQVTQALVDEYTVEYVDLEAGLVGDQIDVLVLVAPQMLSDRAQFSIDQYLMRGGSLIVAASNFSLAPDMLSGLTSLQPIFSGMAEMLEHYGIQVGQELVLDLQNSPFPVSVPRTIDNMTINEYRALDYPFFVDIRSDAMAEGNPALANLTAVTLNYVSPVTLVEETNTDRVAQTLMYSSADSWLAEDINIQPDFEQYAEFGFPVPPETERGSHPLAVTVQGQFTSYFVDKPNPWTVSENGDETATEAQSEFNVIETSPDDTRLVVVGSAEFLDDMILDLMGLLVQDQIDSNLLFLQNLVDWSLEDVELLSIRARGNTIRVLKPLERQEQVSLEILNYVLALLALVIVAGVWRWRSSHQTPLDEEREMIL